MTTNPPTDPKPDIKSFASMLVEHRSGRTEAELSQMLHDLTSQVRAQEKGGKLVISIDVKPLTDDATSVAVAVDMSVKVPRPPAAPAHFFIGDDGNLSVTDPWREPLFPTAPAQQTLTEGA